MRYIECPDEYEGNAQSLFLAGGIMDCGDWQTPFAKTLEETDIVLINPRRKSFNMLDEGMRKEQIAWEFRHLSKADAISFWFPKETLCPITLYELGSWARTDKPIFVGIDPDYARKENIEEQLHHIRPDVKIVYSLQALTSQIKQWTKASIK